MNQLIGRNRRDGRSPPGYVTYTMLDGVVVTGMVAAYLGESDVAVYLGSVEVARGTTSDEATHSDILAGRGYRFSIVLPDDVENIDRCRITAVQFGVDLPFLADMPTSG